MDITGYHYANDEGAETDGYLLPVVLRCLDLMGRVSGSRIFELGCGNGSVARALAGRGFQVTGVDPSREGISQARKSCPHLNLEEGSSEADLAGKFGRFPVVLSLEVIEHVYAPREFVHRIWDLLEPDGVAIISTPYHGYFKNLALAAAGKLDQHFTALWDHGHIKFWSVRTLGKLLAERGFKDINFQRVGRIPPLAKSMIVTARKCG
jgi:2-polyprenyl-3-methyl-5-hydroxy-6-metoxy-1,4-benzoquinol methylase